MTLLVEVMEKPLDPGYAEEAERRAEAARAGHPARRRGLAVVLLLLLAALLGLLTVSAARQLRAPQADVAAAREVLENQIVDRRAEVESLQGRSVALSDEIEGLQHTALASEDPGLLQTLQRDGVVSGSAAVSGPGLVVSLSDGDAAQSEADPDASARVRDADVQTVVNALWAAGAEAISVDDQRLTSLSAIRNAGDAILVDLVPLPGPTYVIRAIGDADDMQTAYARSGAPAYLQLLGSRYGIQSSVTPQSDLSLPGVGNQTLRYATPSGAGQSAPGSDPQETSSSDTEEERS
ncbi:DUF881 domain-containing protein [Krasilnikoviella flava]|uniref:Uncharacterized conserved protein YlxW, UPF0749 family n=1 Tax=Krasilnikoviella flava TaxID=526729 RepID=A0A1T5L5T8_9MICO|nr:DUF881 domain-containing protein [Krasilnikoviella flava]SKC71270.1 Uncharacterized conserved protein YlxW, UPF0749 family [Krasilnikoviella flava]